MQIPIQREQLRRMLHKDAESSKNSSQSTCEKICNLGQKMYSSYIFRICYYIGDLYTILDFRGRDRNLWLPFFNDGTIFRVTRLLNFCTLCTEDNSIMNLTYQPATRFAMRLTIARDLSRFSNFLKDTLALIRIFVGRFSFEVGNSKASVWYKF